jgi:hypothetical protein
LGVKTEAELNKKDKAKKEKRKGNIEYSIK